jgi:hypothetical protein
MVSPILEHPAPAVIRDAVRRCTARRRSGLPQLVAVAPWVRRVDDVGMTIEDNKTVVRRFIDALFTEGDLEATDDYLSDDFVNHLRASGCRPTPRACAQPERCSAPHFPTGTAICTH